MAEEKTLSNDELESRWTTLRQVLDNEGTAACLAVIRAEPDDAYKNQLFRLAVRKLGGGVGATVVDLDAMVTIGNAAIQHGLETADHRNEDMERWKDHANVLAYNLSANLCDCWGDGDSRQKRHFEAGLRYADQGLELRRQLKKGPGPFSMAHWARGKHLLSLGRASEAAEAFRGSLACEESLVRENGGDPDALGTAPGGLLNSRAFLGLSLLRSGNAAGKAMLEEALAVLRLRANEGEGEAKEDAQVYADQVEESVRRN